MHHCDASETWYRLAKEAAAERDWEAVLLSGAPVMQPHLLQTLRPALLRAAAVLYKGLVESANECGRDEYAIFQSLTGLNHVICYGPGVTLAVLWQAALGAASDSLKTCSVQIALEWDFACSRCAKRSRAAVRSLPRLDSSARAARASATHAGLCAGARQIRLCRLALKATRPWRRVSVAAAH